MRLDDGWNQIQFNLSDFTRRAYGTNYIETLRVQVSRGTSCPHTPMVGSLPALLQVGNLGLSLTSSFTSCTLYKAVWEGSKDLTEAAEVLVLRHFTGLGWDEEAHFCLVSLAGCWLG